MNMTAVDNEKLCALAQTGDMDALNSLVENNLRFIKMTAHEIWSAQIEVNRALGVTFDDLVQEGCLGLMGCVEKFNPDGGNKFLTYAAPAIRNSMIDYIRSQSTSFEAKHMGEIVSLDEVMKFENRDRHAFIPDSNMTNPAQIYIAKETHEELHAALDAISNREREYLLYRFGFEDDMEHPLTETAEHFFLSESRAKSTEKLALDNVWLELPWWFHWRGERTLRRVFIYLLRPRWHRKSFRAASRFPMPTTHEQPGFAHGKFLVFCCLQPTKSACSAAA